MNAHQDQNDRPAGSAAMGVAIGAALLVIVVSALYALWLFNPAVAIIGFFTVLSFGASVWRGDRGFGT